MSGGRLGIGILLTYLPRDRAGGAQLQAVRMAAELSKHHDVTLFTRGDENCAAGLDLANVRLVTRQPPDVYGLRLLDDSPLGFRQIRASRSRLDVLVCYQSIAAGWLGVHAARRLQLPCLVFVRGRHEYQMGRVSRFRLLVPHVYRHADRVLVQAPQLAAEILEQFDRPGLRRIRDRLRDRIGVVPNGVEMQPPRPDCGRGVVYVGRLIAAKGVGELIDAMQRLPGQRLTIVGDGPERPQLEERARGLPVTFTGQLDHALARQQIREARCLALPSHSEAFPNVVLEALAAGTPVVVARTGGVPALVDDERTGLLVEPGNVDQLAGALARITHDQSLCLDLSARAHAAASAFAWPLVAERLVTEVRLVLDRRDSAAEPRDTIH